MAALGPDTPALELAAALRARELSAVELLDSCLAAVDELNPLVNAVIWRNDDGARAAAADADRRLAAGESAPFLGVPLPIKDLTPVAGWPVTYGSNGAPEGASEESSSSWTRSRARASCCAGARTRPSSASSPSRRTAATASPATPGI